MQRWVGTVLATTFLISFVAMPVMVFQQHNHNQSPRTSLVRMIHGHNPSDTHSSNTTSDYHTNNSVGD